MNSFGFKKKLLLATFMSVLVSSALIATASYAFGGMNGSSEKVLGVGRIQSDPLSTPITSDDKFILDFMDSTAQTVGTSVLTSPISHLIPDATASAEDSTGSTFEAMATVPLTSEAAVSDMSASATSAAAADTATPTSAATSATSAAATATATTDTASATPAATAPAATAPATTTSNTAPPAASATDTASATPPSSSTSSSGTGANWLTGWASAYGLDNAGPVTYSGQPLTEDSMGVAVPESESYLVGKTVEIKYNNQVVQVLINDTGGFGNLGRTLDLQPGVWKAFGFSDEYSWGVRTVQYRIID